MRGDVGFPVRVRYTKHGKVRFVSHRDLARSFERAFRIAALPLAFTQGFSPRPKVSLGLALGVGYESDGEYLDFELVEPIDVDALPGVLTDGLPEGVAVDDAVVLLPRAPALQEAITTVAYTMRPADITPVALGGAVNRALAAEQLSIETTRKGRPVVEDLRPGIRSLVAIDDVLEAELATQPRGIRPAELLGALRDLAVVVPADGEDRVLRTHQWIERDGARQEPLEADRAPRASDDARGTSKGLINDRRDNDRGGGDGADGSRPDHLRTDPFHPEAARAGRDQEDDDGRNQAHHDTGHPDAARELDRRIA